MPAYMRRAHLAPLLLLLLLACCAAVIQALQTRTIGAVRIDAQEAWPQPTSECTLATCVSISWSITDGGDAAHSQCSSPRFSLFAHDANVDATTTPPVVLCTTAERECMVARSALPAAASTAAPVDLALPILAECSDAQQSQSLQWMPSLSPLVHVSLPSVDEVAEPLWTAAVAAPGVAPLVLNDDGVRAALCQFFNETGGPGWRRADGWCDPAVSVCEWFGVRCSPDTDALTVTGLLLPDNLLDNVRVAGAPVPFSNALFAQLPALVDLDLGNNQLTIPVPMDLSPLVQLRTLNLSAARSVLSVFRIPADVPGGWGLQVLDVSHSHLMMPFKLLPNLRELYADDTSTVLDMAQLPYAPQLRVLRACDARLTTQPERCGLITQAIFSALDTTNPALEVLAMGASALEFNINKTVTVGVSNFPVLRASRLRLLNLSFTPSLHCGRGGPPDDWLGGMPMLEELHLAGLQGTQAFGSGSSPSPYSPSAASPFDSLAVFNTSALLSGSRRLRSLVLAGTAVVGSLAPLHTLHSLEVINFDSTGVADTLPPAVSALWPNLTAFAICCSGIYGTLPSFADLPRLRLLSLPNNAQLGGPVNPLFLRGSENLEKLDLSDNGMTGALPALTNFTQLHSLFLCNNAWTDAFPSTWNLPRLEQLSISHNRLTGSLPAGFWEGHPRLVSLDLRSNALEGRIPSAATPRWLELFSLTNNKFTGPIPENITALGYELSYSQ